MILARSDMSTKKDQFSISQAAEAMEHSFNSDSEDFFSSEDEYEPSHSSNDSDSSMDEGNLFHDLI